MEGKGKENLPLLNHCLLHFQSQWGFLEGPVRPRDLDSVYVCMCPRGHKS